MQEKPRYRRYYEYYFQLPYLNPPRKRTFGNVSKKFGVSDRWISKISKEFDWDKRCKERDKEIMNILEENMKDEIVLWKKKCFNIINNAIKDTNINIKTAHELKALIESGLKLLGEPDKHEIKHKTDKIDIALFKKYLNED